MSCQACGSSCSCAVGGSASVAVTGNGSATSPYNVALKISGAAGNNLAMNPDGVYASASAGLPAYTTAGRPASPAVGFMYYDTTLQTIMVYTAAGVGYTKPWGLPWGRVAYGQAATQGTPTAGGLDVVSGVSFTAVTNRQYEIRVTVHNYSSGPANALHYEVWNASNTPLMGITNIAGAALTPQETAAASASKPWAGSGAQTWKLRVVSVAGTGTASFFSDSLRTTNLAVYDVGPAGAAV